MIYWTGAEWRASGPQAARPDVYRALRDARWRQVDPTTWTTSSSQRAAQAALALEALGLPQPLAKRWRLASSLGLDADLPAFPTPAGHDLKPFQRVVPFLLTQEKALLVGDEMGTGKTVMGSTSITAVGAKSVLIVSPLTLKAVWRAHLRDWLVEPLPILMLTTRTPDPELRMALAQPGIILAHPESLVKHASTLAEHLFDLVVVDEAHFYKNPTAQRTKALRQLHATYRLALTGTPIKNRVPDIHPVIDWLQPGQWGSQTAFAEKFKRASSLELEDFQAALRLRVMVRRLKRDVLSQLPPKLRTIVAVDPAEDRALQEALKREQQAEQERLAEIAQLEAELAEKKAGEDYQRKAMRLRYLSVPLQALAKVRKETALAKVPWCVRFAEEILAEQDKVVVFAWHKEVVARLAEGLSAYHPVIITGETPVEERELAVKAFQHDPRTRVFIGNMLAAGQGITLTAASTVIFAELDWTPANLSQAEDRCHRIGQADNVLVFHVVVDGSIDAKEVVTIIDKQREHDAALDTLKGTREEAALNRVETAADRIALAVQQRMELVRSLTRVQAKWQIDEKTAYQHRLKVGAGMVTQSDQKVILADLRHLLNQDACSASTVKLATSFASRSSLTPKQAAYAIFGVLVVNAEGLSPDHQERWLTWARKVDERALVVRP
jgi:SWI/SNF-related matrix-associated actin-dependent regulator 1 of chromatin subfamily A